MEKVKKRRTSTLVVSLVLSVLASCARPVEVDPGAAADGEKKLAQLATTIWGTRQQKAAGEVLQYHAYQDPIKACMDSHGFTYNPPPFAEPYTAGADVPIPDGLGKWVGSRKSDRLGSGLATTAMQLAPLDDERDNPYFDNLDAATKKKYDVALDACQPDPYPKVNFPKLTAKLDDELAKVVASVEKRPDVSERGKHYASCLSSKGFTAETHSELITAAQAEIGQHKPPRPGAVAGTGWTKAVDFEKSAAAADATCREPVQLLILTILPPRLDEFESEFAADLEAVADEWDVIVAQAAKYPEGQRR